MPRRAPLPPGVDPREHPALKGGHVVILGGEKPLFPVTGPVGHAALGQMLEQKGFDYEPCHGKYEGDKQPSYIVHVRNDGEDETLKGIASRMGQESVVHSEGGKHQLVFLNGENKGKATAPTAGLEWYGDNEPDDNYTTLYGASGEPLGHFKYNMDFTNPMVPDGPGPMVDVPEAAQQVLKSAIESYRGVLLDLRKRETDRLSKKLNPGMGADRDTSAPHPDGSSLSPNRPSHPFSEPTRPTTGGAIDARIAKYMTEGGQHSKVRGNKPSSDISTQGPHGRSSPHSGNIVSKAETPMKLHDLMKSQARPHYGSWAEAAKANSTPVIGQNPRAGKPSVEHTLFEESDPKVLHPSDKKVKKDEFPTSNKFSNKLAAGREQSPAAAAAKDTFTQRAAAPTSPNAFKSEPSDKSKECGLVGCKDPHSKEREYEGKKVKVCSFHADKMDRPGGYLTVVKGEESMSKAQCTCGLKDCQWCGKAPKKQSNEQGEHGGSPKKPSYQPGDEMKVTKSIWKKMPEMNKAQTNAHASAKRNGGTIKLGKQEFYIDHQNPTAPQKDDKTASIPGGKETGWRTGGQKPAVIEASASGGAISANKPKAGPDQKNTSENSVTEGAIKPKATPKNDLIEKAASDFHKRTGGRFLKPKKETSKESTRPSPEESALDEGRHNPQDFEKAAPAMGAPKAPSAGGAGSPTLSGGAPTKPPTTHATANPKAFGKAVGDFGSTSTRGTPGAGQKPGFDASIVPPGTGASPLSHLTGPAIPATPGAAPGGFKSPAQHKGITGFLGKKELCKSCGKSHPLGKCA